MPASWFADISMAKSSFLDVPEDGINAAHYRGGGNIKQSLTPFMASTRPF